MHGNRPCAYENSNEDFLEGGSIIDLSVPDLCLVELRKEQRRALRGADMANIRIHSTEGLVLTTHISLVEACVQSPASSAITRLQTLLMNDNPTKGVAYPASGTLHRNALAASSNYIDWSSRLWNRFMYSCRTAFPNSSCGLPRFLHHHFL